MSLSNPNLESAQEYPIGALVLRPDILTHPNIPKPLHEVNPRNIMGELEWDKMRKEAYASTGYHCVACGVHKSQAKCNQWLEAHEFYNIDYEAGRVEVDRIVPLCHYCHNFIHSGRLSMIIGKEKTLGDAIEILEHGFKILADNELSAFYFTLNFAEQIGADTYGVLPSDLPNYEMPAWEDWRLIWGGEEYSPKYKTYEEWLKRFSK